MQDCGSLCLLTLLSPESNQRRHYSQGCAAIFPTVLKKFLVNFQLTILQTSWTLFHNFGTHETNITNHSLSLVVSLLCSINSRGHSLVLNTKSPATLTVKRLCCLWPATSWNFCYSLDNCMELFLNLHIKLTLFNQSLIHVRCSQTHLVVCVCVEHFIFLFVVNLVFTELYSKHPLQISFLLVTYFSSINCSCTHNSSRCG